MAKEVLTQASVLVNSVDLSDHASSVSMEDAADEVEVTGFTTSDYREFIPGLKDGNITVSFFNDHAAGSVADTLQPLYTSGGTFALRIKPDIAGTVAYTMTARLYNNTDVQGPPPARQCHHRKGGSLPWPFSRGTRCSRRRIWRSARSSCRLSAVR
jgi:hypothetical protein